ncbi:MAG: S1 RNA-binding domain-containing protein, partial [Planctomycetota bacterium]
GVFVELEENLEGLLHVSELSTRKIHSPEEVVKVGDEVEVVILEIDKDKQEIGLGMKQAEVNPWDLVEEKYPPGTIVEGQVRNLTNYGAFVALEEGIDGLLHISDMSWTKKVTHPSEMLTEGDRVKAIVLSVDRDKKRVSLGLKQLAEDPWKTQIADRYKVGDVVVGTVTKITNFGVFVELEENLEGLLHVSELSTRKIHSPEEVVQVGDQVEVTVLKVDAEERKIGLSLIASDDGGGPKIVRRGGGAEKAAAATEPAPETPAEPEAVAEAPEAVAEEPAPAEAEEAPVADPEPVAEPAAEEETAVEPEAEPAAETAEEPAPESEPVAEPATGEETAVEPEAEPAVETAKEPAVAPEPEPAAEAEDKPAEEEAGEEAEKA